MQFAYKTERSCQVVADQIVADQPIALLKRLRQRQFQWMEHQYNIG